MKSKQSHNDLGFHQHHKMDEKDQTEWRLLLISGDDAPSPAQIKRTEAPTPIIRGAES